ncbi:hypothetical protein J3R82DRAFT_3593 [Butyriboletus roseoflavus]|nr:hypothetical protein J3R82DRAFT_3593 [Butyriboletus roseoflavus]
MSTVTLEDDIESTFGHNQIDYDIPIFLNKDLSYDKPHQQDVENGHRHAIPDFQLCFAVNHMDKPLMIQKWISEVTFTTSTSKTHDCLKDITATNSTIDLIFLFCVDKSPQWKSLAMDDPFQENGSRIIWRNFIWASITQISLEVYMCSSQGKLIVNVDQQGECSAHGLLHPFLSIDDVDQLLTDVSRALKMSLLALMESHGEEAEYIDQVCQTTGTLMVS